jgi:hypothetical protein
MRKINKRRQKQSRNKNIFIYLQRNLENEFRRIICQIILLEINMQESKPEEEYVHQNRNI